MKSKLVALIVGVGLMLWGSVGTAGAGVDVITGNRVVTTDTEPSPEQEKREKERPEGEREDRQEKKQGNEEKGTEAQNARRESDDEKAKAASIKKLERKTGRKVKSWQLLNR